MESISRASDGAEFFIPHFSTSHKMKSSQDNWDYYWLRVCMHVCRLFGRYLQVILAMILTFISNTLPKQIVLGHYN